VGHDLFGQEPDALLHLVVGEHAVAEPAEGLVDALGLPHLQAVHQALGVADFFVIASGRSTRQVQAIAEHVWESYEGQGGRVWHVEGLREGMWVLLDCGDIIVHVFHPQMRHFYGLERLWGDMPRLSLPA